MDSSIPKSVLFDFFEGKATSLQRKLIEEWLAVPGNKILFFQSLNEWESKHPQYLPDTEQALEHYTALLNDSVMQMPSRSMAEETLLISRSFPWKSWIQAASIVLLLGVFVSLFQRTIRYKSFQTGNARTQVVHLKDGTQVTLNANSILYVPRWGFASSHREVLLEGEAEFVVSHTDDNKRFIVKTNDDFEVEVLGTEFVMFARDRGKKVTLNKGSVKVHYQEGKKLALHPGEMVTFGVQNSSPKLRKVSDPQIESAWKNHQFYFDNTPLTEVAEVIQEHFGVKVVLADSSLTQRRLSGYFKASTAQEIAQTISTLLDIHIEQTEKKLVIHNPSSQVYE
jgi:transmembrane sensor